ncbi:hypothetical protein QUF74_17250 [Candidatus Halobeggiatoa sp. HSG11]|nr:hypothetical protein [Candidatus Halobeggiatoa sp. HSG11]
MTFKDTKSVIIVSSDEIKEIFGNDDIVKLEYPADEFPTPKTKIIITFAKKTKKQYIELSEWLNLLEDYNANKLVDISLSDENSNETSEEHDKEFVCVISFRVDSDDETIGKTVVSPEDRDDCIKAILKKYPNEHLDLSSEFMCKHCFEEMLLKELEDLEFDHGSKTIH